MLGICYNYNLGVEEQDAEKRGVIASEYFIKSAELGHKDGMCFAGLCFLHGIGVEQDIQKAIEWFEKSAEQNGTQAMNNLGLLYKQNKAELEENESYVIRKIYCNFCGFFIFFQLAVYPYFIIFSKMNSAFCIFSICVVINFGIA